MPPRVNLPVISAISRTIARHHTTGRMEPAISKGADVDALKQRLNPLLSTNGGRWTLTKNGEAMERTFKFKTFTKTWVSGHTLYPRHTHCYSTPLSVSPLPHPTSVLAAAPACDP